MIQPTPSHLTVSCKVQRCAHESFITRYMCECALKNKKNNIFFLAESCKNDTFSFLYNSELKNYFMIEQYQSYSNVREA